MFQIYIEFMENKQPIAPLLKNLKLYDSETFPLERYTSVNAAITTVQTGTDLKFKRERNNSEKTLKVIRIA